MAEAPPCPYCRRRPAAPDYAPFCSERCKMADLGRWLAGDYRVPATPDPDGAESPDDADSTESSN